MSALGHSRRTKAGSGFADVRFAPKVMVGIKKEPRQAGPPVGRASSAGLHRVIAAQRPITGLDCPTAPKVELALRPSVTTITKECISPPSL